MTLLDLLAQDLLKWMDDARDGVPRGVLLWLDPECQFKRLVQHLETILQARDTRFLFCEHTESASQLHLKLALLNLMDASGKSRVEFMDLEVLLRGGKVPGSPLLVVLDNELDEQGHKGTEQLPRLVGAFIRNLRRAIDRLHEAGIETVHVVTDHGFLLLPPEAVDALGRPQVLPG